MMTRQEAIDLYNSDDLIGIGMAADAVRRKLHPDGVVSYIIDRNITTRISAPSIAASVPSTGRWAITKAMCIPRT